MIMSTYIIIYFILQNKHQKLGGASGLTNFLRSGQRKTTGDIVWEKLTAHASLASSPVLFPF